MIRKAIMEFKLEYAVDLDDSVMVDRVSQLMEEEFERILAGGYISDYITIKEDVDITEDQVRSTNKSLELFKIGRPKSSANKISEVFNTN